MSYFQLYHPDGINKTGVCKCGHCSVYPELYHALPVLNEHIPTIQRAKMLQSANPDSVIIEKHETFTGSKNYTSYTNHTTGVTWKYNGKKWLPNK